MRYRAILKAKWIEPLNVVFSRAEQPWVAALLSDGSQPHGRWSYVAWAPDAVIVMGCEERADPIADLRRLRGHLTEPAEDGPPFQGGLIGLAAYELGARIEPIALGLSGWPDLVCGRYPALLAFDHQDRCVWAIGRGENQADADRRAGAMIAALETVGSAVAPASGALAQIEPEPPAAYERAVADVVGRIAAGEIFQANIARRWRGRLADGRTPFDLLTRLSAASPAPFAAYLRLEDLAAVSNSPERFVRVRPAGGEFVIETRPIKGTAPRGGDPAEDRALARDLAASAKDRAENLMIVDLMRNDLARVSPPGAVEVPDLFRIETFANVHHLVSTVTGRLAEGLDAFDLLKAAFPPGSITGAPKVQAMRVISALEPARGPYCGSMFWAGFDGAFDSSVLIRTARFDREPSGVWQVEARAGAGIVADSDPVSERRETEAKIAAILAALTGDGA